MRLYCVALNYEAERMNEIEVNSAEIEVADALYKHARLLSTTKDPRKKIAAAQWELRLQAELEKLQLNGKEEPAHA